jgi:phenylalanyl-tRNA synthetase beta chain
MKVSLNWVKQYLDFELPAVDELVERIGAQLGAVEEVENLGEKYQGIIVAKVVSCEDHPDADRLHVCKIDDGGKAQNVERDENDHVQVVCGAPNVREGLLVAWLPPGTTVPASVGKEPFVLERREIRGVISNGMLASPKELALGDSHDGILELGEAPNPRHSGLDPESKAVDSGSAAGMTSTKAPKPGDDFAQTFGLDDTVIDIENKMFTHRPDCFGVLGVAREIAGISGQQFTSPDWYLRTQREALDIDGESLSLGVRNELPELVPRFLVVPLSNVTVKPSPLWLQTYLLRSGIRPINNVVDITNYMMLLTGQPMHAYDYDKVKTAGGGESCLMIIRYPKHDEELSLLSGKTVRPRDEAILIATATRPIGIGGVMGGGETEVDENTKNVILECANFDMYSIRRTSMAHGLFTDAVTRFNKGQSPLQNAEVNAKAVQMLRELAGAKVAGSVIDNNHVDEQSRERRWVHPPVPVTTEFINSRLGFDLSATDIQRLLGNVECSVTADGDRLLVTAPFWRTDIETREDVVEEVGRLYGFDKLPLELPKRSIQPVPKDPLFELKSKVRDTLAKAGANEVLTYSFVHGDLLQKAGQDPAHAFQVGNALSPDLQYYRLSLTPSLLDKVYPNIKAGYDEFALFELGKTHSLRHTTDDDGLPAELEMLDLVYANSDKHWKSGPAFYDARKFLLRLVNHFGFWIEYRLFESESDDPAAKPYDYTRSARVFVRGTDIELGIVGEFKANVRRALKLPVRTAGFSISLTAFMQAAEHPTIDWYQPLPRFPSVTQDVTLQVPAELPFDALYWFVAQEAKLTASEHAKVLFPRVVDIYQASDDKSHKRITLRLVVANYERTLTDVEVNKLLDDVAAAAHEKFGAERV